MGFREPLDNFEYTLNKLAMPKPAASRPRGRGRPPTIDTEKLLKVAREVFFERGIRATTAEVAERAGVSEGTIFHRFKTKEDLFRQAMRLDPEDLAKLFREALDGIEGMDLRPGLEQLATRLLEIGRHAIPLMMMSWSNPVNAGPPCQLPLPKLSAYRALIRIMIGFFEDQIHRGRLRPVDAEVVARVFLGSMHHYTMVRLMVPDAEQIVIPEGMFVRGLVDLVLEGAVARGDSPSAPEEALGSRST